MNVIIPSLSVCICIFNIQCSLSVCIIQREVKECPSVPDGPQVASEVSTHLTPHQLSLITIS